MVLIRLFIVAFCAFIACSYQDRVKQVVKWTKVLATLSSINDNNCHLVSLLGIGDLKNNLTIVLYPSKK